MAHGEGRPGRALAGLLTRCPGKWKHAGRGRMEGGIPHGDMSQMRQPQCHVSGGSDRRGDKHKAERVSVRPGQTDPDRVHLWIVAAVRKKEVKEQNHIHQRKGCNLSELRPPVEGMKALHEAYKSFDANGNVEGPGACPVTARFQRAPKCLYQITAPNAETHTDGTGGSACPAWAEGRSRPSLASCRRPSSL